MTGLKDRMDAIVGDGRYRSEADARAAAEAVRLALPGGAVWDIKAEYDRDDREWTWEMKANGMEVSPSIERGRFHAVFRYEIVAQGNKFERTFTGMGVANDPVDAMRLALGAAEQSMQSAIALLARAKRMVG